MLGNVLLNQGVREINTLYIAFNIFENEMHSIQNLENYLYYFFPLLHVMYGF